MDFDISLPHQYKYIRTKINTHTRARPMQLSISFHVMSFCLFNKYLTVQSSNFESTSFHQPTKKKKYISDNLKGKLFRFVCVSEWVCVWLLFSLVGRCLCATLQYSNGQSTISISKLFFSQKKITFSIHKWHFGIPEKLRRWFVFCCCCFCYQWWCCCCCCCHFWNLQ